MNRTGNTPGPDFGFQPLSKTRRQHIAALSVAKRRRKERLFVVEGEKNVGDLLSRGGGFEPVWLVATPDYLTRNAEALREAAYLDDDQISVASEAEMREISSLSTPSDLLAVFRMPQPVAVSGARRLPEGLYLLLDGVQDPGNLGTIIRTAHWFGIRHIFASRDTVDLYNPKTVQSTMGSLGAVTVEYLDLPDLVAENPQMPLVGLQLDGADLFSTPLPSSAFICMGSEGNGLSKDMQERLTLSLTIPATDPSDHPESLNVAIATAITLASFRSGKSGRCNS